MPGNLADADYNAVDKFSFACHRVCESHGVDYWFNSARVTGSIQMHIGLRRSYKYNGYIGVSYCSCGNVLSDISAMNVVSEKDVTLNSFLS